VRVTDLFRGRRRPNSAPMSNDTPPPQPEPMDQGAEPAMSPEQVMEAAAARIEAAAARIATLEAERDEFRDKWLRSEAEMANVRARAKRDADDARQFAVQKFARDVVEAADNLRRGLDSLPPQTADEPAIVTKLRDGFEGVERSFLALLERNGINRVEATGQPFDANLHQAMAEQPSSEYPPGTVIQSWTAGWTLNGRLLRPAMVVVSRAPDNVQPEVTATR
jgi:molecular chaperone GrpE